MTDEIAAQVLRAAEATGEPFEIIEIDPELADTETFCARYGYPLETSANCIVVASKAEPPALAACVVLATDRLDVNRRVRKLLGARKCSFASAALTREATGMEIGGVTPLGLPEDLPLWIDARVMDHERVIIGGGSRSLKLHVAPSALTAASGEVVEDLALPG